PRIAIDLGAEIGLLDEQEVVACVVQARDSVDRLAALGLPGKPKEVPPFGRGFDWLTGTESSLPVRLRLFRAGAAVEPKDAGGQRRLGQLPAVGRGDQECLGVEQEFGLRRYPSRVPIGELLGFLTGVQAEAERSSRELVVGRRVAAWEGRDEGQIR